MKKVYTRRSVLFPKPDESVRCLTTLMQTAAAVGPLTRECAFVSLLDQHSVFGLFKGTQLEGG